MNERTGYLLARRQNAAEAEVNRVRSVSSSTLTRIIGTTCKYSLGIRAVCGSDYEEYSKYEPKDDGQASNLVGTAKHTH